MSEPAQSDKPSWTALVSEARKAAPPADLDIRFSLRRAIEAERALASQRKSAPQPTIWDDLAALAGFGWFRGVMAASFVVALPLFFAGLKAGGEVLHAIAIAGPMLAGL